MIRPTSPNRAVERTAGSHSLAAAAHRDRLGDRPPADKKEDRHAATQHARQLGAAVPAWSVNFGGSPSLAVAYCGVQSHTGDITDSEAAFALLRSGRDAPDHVERGRFKDVLISYGSPTARWIMDSSVRGSHFSVTIFLVTI